MIIRQEFITEYEVSPEMTSRELRLKRKSAREANLSSMNSSIDSEKIVSIVEKSFVSRNADDSPFWEKLVVYYKS